MSQELEQVISTMSIKIRKMLKNEHSEEVLMSYLQHLRISIPEVYTIGNHSWERKLKIEPRQLRNLHRLKHEKSSNLKIEKQHWKKNRIEMLWLKGRSENTAPKWTLKLQILEIIMFLHIAIKKESIKLIKWGRRMIILSTSWKVNLFTQRNI